MENLGEIIIYKTESGENKIDVKLIDETLWLTQSDMAELFQTSKQNISLHIQNIYEENELSADSTVKKYLTVRKEGNREVKRYLDYYNLDMIISVGYRVRSIIATRFRIWATDKLKEFIIKGFVMDDERLKNPHIENSKVPDYFDEMLSRIRDIRASERRMYLRVREIFAIAADYEPSLKETTRFFSTIQNKLHFAATGQTAAEIINARVDSKKLNMGLTNWKGSEVRKTDVGIAKNYLEEHEIDELNRIVVMWLDFAEDQAKRKKLVYLRNWEQKLDDFLHFNDRNVLEDKGKIGGIDARKKAYAEYETYDKKRRKEKEMLAERDYMNQLKEAAKHTLNRGNK